MFCGLIAENEREFDYGEKSGKGPRKWGEMKKEWAACTNGTLQSPVDMSNERVKIISRPDTRIYKAANATVKNRGHDIQVRLIITNRYSFRPVQFDTFLDYISEYRIMETCRV